MTIAITSVTGVGGSPPTSLVVSGTVSTCEQVEVTTSCSASPVIVAIPTGGPNVWDAVLPNDKRCPCGHTVEVAARCTIGEQDAVRGTFTIVCTAPGSCFDNPDDILRSDICVGSLSKDVRGETVLESSSTHRCEKQRCVTLRTAGVLKVALSSHAPCDHHLGQLLSGSLVVQPLATVYEDDGLGRGVHAGDFRWITAQHDEIDGRMSGITNGGLVREAPFHPAVEKCISEGILVGRLCGRVAKTADPRLKQAQVVATYRLHAAPTAKGENGAVRGTLEGVVVTPC